jgi:hypothetical protein
MTTDIDVYRSAHTLIEQHGEGAAIQAAMEADAIATNYPQARPRFVPTSIFTYTQKQ